MKLIVGLGNPGDKYFGTRHNLGFAVVEEFVHKHNLGEWQSEKKFKSEIIRAKFPVEGKEEEVILARPQTYMNLSGMAVSGMANFFKVSPEDIIVIHDELDLMLGKIKVRLGGAAAGHHGVENVIEKLGSDKFVRIRLGIGNTKTRRSEHNSDHTSPEQFVVSSFSEHEHSDVKHMLKQALKALETLLDKGLEKAQNQFN